MPVPTRMMSLMHHPGRLFPTWNRALSDFDTLFRRHTPMNEGLNFVPLFDVRENKDNYFLEADMPGVAKKDINVQVADQNTIRITGHSERSTSSKDTEDSWLCSERMVGDYSRSLSFPTPIDDEHVEATLKDGVLSITVPKAGEPTSTKHIEVK